MKGKIIITAKFNNFQWDGKSDSEILSDVKSADDECFSTESVVVIRSQPQQGEGVNSAAQSGPTNNGSTSPAEIADEIEVCCNCDHRLPDDIKQFLSIKVRQLRACR